MSDQLLVAMIGALPATIASVAALLVSMRNGRKVEEVRKATNHMKDELVAITDKEAHARGVKDERKRRRDEPEELVD